MQQIIDAYVDTDVSEYGVWFWLIQSGSVFPIVHGSLLTSQDHFP